MSEINRIKDLINKKSGTTVAHTLNKEQKDDPTSVKLWIPTGSRVLDSIICKGKMGGIPVGKLSELAGLESSGKSYMAAMISANAQNMGIKVAYFDSEVAIDPTFLKDTGCDLDDLLYIQATSIEFFFETIEQILSETQDKWIFILDSLSFTPCRTELEGNFDPSSQMAIKARILSRAMAKLIMPLANKNCTLLILNQLRTNISKSPTEMLINPYVTTGGKSLNYACSLRIWLTARKSKSSFVLDENNFRVGSNVKAELKKSRFGTQYRQCAFSILWGGNKIAIEDEKSWLEYLKSSENLVQKGAWFALKYEDGTEQKFQTKNWLELLEKDEKFKKRVIELLDYELIYKFAHKKGNADDYYNIDGEPEKEADEK